MSEQTKMQKKVKEDNQEEKKADLIKIDDVKIIEKTAEDNKEESE